MIIEETIALLASENVGTVGVDLLIGELPLDKKECMTAVYAVSPEPNKTFDVYEQTIDFWSRYKSSQEAYAKLVAVMNVLHKRKHYDLDTFHIYSSLALGMIEDMDRTVDRLKLYKLTIRFIFRPK